MKLCERWYQVGRTGEQAGRRVPENGVNESNQVAVTQTKREKAEKRWQKNRHRTVRLSADI